MLKNLFARIARMVVPAPPTALEIMKACLRETEVEYLATLDQQEAYACVAEMKAVEAKHDFNRCQRLQRFIDSEQRAQYEAAMNGGPSVEELDAIMRSAAVIFESIAMPKQEDNKKDPMPPEANAYKA